MEAYYDLEIRLMGYTSSAVPTVEATEAVASAKIDVAQLKRLVIVYKISCYKLATCFADSFFIIAITRSALLTKNAPQTVWRPGSARTQTVCLLLGMNSKYVARTPSRAYRLCSLTPRNKIKVKIRGLD